MPEFTLPPPPFLNVTNQPSVAKSNLNVITEDRAYRAVDNVQVFQCTCLRCGHVWHTLQQTKPKSCPSKDCHSTYWDRAPSQTHRETKLMKKQKLNGIGDATRGVKLPGGKNAARKVSAVRPAQQEDAGDAALPEVPVELLAAVGQSAYPGAGSSGGDAEGFADDLPAAAPDDDGTSVSVGGVAEDDPGVSVGQSDDDGRGADAADTAEPETVPDQGEEDLAGADDILRGMGQ